MYKLGFNDISTLVYIKPKYLQISIYRDIDDPEVYELPIQYAFEGNMFYLKKYGIYNDGKKDNNPHWLSDDFKKKYKIYNDKDIKEILDYLDSKHLWKAQKDNIYTYLGKKYLNQMHSKQKPNSSNNTRKKSVYNKNNRVLPKGWHRLSKNGKNRFEGPNGEVYNTMTRFENKNNARVLPQTYKRTEGDDTWYVLPDGSISWYPYYNP